MADERRSEDRLAWCVEDYRRRLARGETVEPEAYREQLGGDWPEFERILVDESLLDFAVSTQERLPRALGPYTLLKRVGRGGQGAVYEATQRGLGRKVAVKVLLAAHDPWRRARFRREARATAQVRHDHIVEIFEAGEFNDQLFYAMALVEGAALDDLIAQGNVPPPMDFCEQAAHVADALQALHDADIVHRDIKPSNLIYDHNGRLVIADFGLAHIGGAQSITDTGQMMGTPEYSSPEQAMGQRDELDGRSDVYGLGATLYEALVGRPPFQGASHVETIRRVVSEQPVPPSQANPSIPEPLERILLKCLEKRPEDRYASAAALAQDLRAFARGDDVKGQPVAKWRHRARTLRRHPMRNVALTLCLLGGLWALATWATRPVMAHLTVENAFGTAVRVNDAPFDPPSQDVPPGEYTVTAKLAGFEDIRLGPYVLVAGGTLAVPIPKPVAKDTDNPQVMDRVGQINGLAHPSPVDPTKQHKSSRASDNFDAVLLYPRGPIRVADLTTFRLEISGRFLDPAHVVFRKGEEVLHVGEAIERMNWIAPMPAAVREALSPGDVLTWGVYDDRDRPVATISCPIVADVANDLDRVTEALRDPPQPPEVEAYFRAQVLAGAGQWSGAALALGRLREAGTTNRLLIRLEGDALEKVFAGNKRFLRMTSYWQDLVATQRRLLADD